MGKVFLLLFLQKKKTLSSPTTHSAQHPAIRERTRMPTLGELPQSLTSLDTDQAGAVIAELRGHSRAIGELFFK